MMPSLRIRPNDFYSLHFPLQVNIPFLFYIHSENIRNDWSWNLPDLGYCSLQLILALYSNIRHKEARRGEPIYKATFLSDYPPLHSNVSLSLSFFSPSLFLYFSRFLPLFFLSLSTVSLRWFQEPLVLIRGLGAIALIIIGRVGECLDSRENDRILGSYWGVTRELLGSY